MCNVCGRVVTELRLIEDRDRTEPCGNTIRINPKEFKVCEGVMLRGLSRVMEPSIMETADTHRNVKWRQNQTERLKKRAKKFFIENEMGEAIAKAGKKEAERLGWIDKKTGKRNKGE